VPTLYVDNVPYRFRGEHRNLLDVCLSLGFDVPYFCWHPAMHSVGACRQCAIKQFKDEEDKRGRIVMACMTQAADGTRISIDDPDARAFRAAVIEWLMANHPHDCPVCDEGGECHLQDMTVMTGHVYRRQRFPKRTFRNQDLGPFISHEMNRCIACYRCVRFYEEMAGGRDLVVLGWHDHVYFGRSEDGPLESEFSGNLIEICPTGVFTDKTLKKHYTRKWDLQTAPSVCVHCGLGCNTIAGERYGTLRRILTRYNADVNGYFLCDRGRFGYEFVNSERRIRRPMVRDGTGELRAATAEDALARVAAILKRGRAIGIGSPRASLETNFALRALVGAENFYCGLPARESELLVLILDLLRKGPWRTPALHEMGAADAVLILGEDLRNSAPMAALAMLRAVVRQPLAIVRALQVPTWEDAAVREAIQQEKGPLFIATPGQTRLDDMAATAYRASPDEVARLGFMVAHSVDHECPPVEDWDEEVLSLAQHMAESLTDCSQPLVIAGTSCGSTAVIRGAANVARALHNVGLKAWLSFTVPECNSMGAAMMGGGTLEDAVKALAEGRADTVVIAENDVLRRLDPDRADALFQAAKDVIVLDHLPTSTTERASVVLPAATFAEADGTLVSNEGRAQRFLQVFVPQGDVRDGWRWLSQARAAAGRGEGWERFDDVARALERELPQFEGVRVASPPADYSVLGQKVPRQPHRYSGRTAVTAHIDVHEPRPPDDPDTPLAFSMEGYTGEPPPALQTRYWAPGWNSVQAINKFQIEVGGPLHGGPVGRRLIEPQEGPGAGYFSDYPPAFEPREDEWLVLALPHIFGSEPLSMMAPGVAERAPQPYVAIGARDAARMGLKEGQDVDLIVRGRSHALPLRVHAQLPRGIAVVPAGLPAMPPLALPAWGRLVPQTEGQP
jgi:NADH-quinone oxidoreductase subunit G